MAESLENSPPILGRSEPSVVQLTMLPVRLAKGLGRHPNQRRDRLAPVRRLRMSQDVPVVENQRFQRHGATFPWSPTTARSSGGIRDRPGVFGAERGPVPRPQTREGGGELGQVQAVVLDPGRENVQAREVAG